MLCFRPVSAPFPVAILALLANSCARSVTAKEDCSFYDFGFDGKDLPPGKYVSSEWEEEYGMRITASTLYDNDIDGWAFTPDGKARLFDTSAPMNDCTGTPGLTAEGLGGDIGNVLIVQHAYGSQYWKANEQGGILVFDFNKPVENIVEIALMNVVRPVEVTVTHVDGTTATVDAQPMQSPKSNHYRKIFMEELVLQVTKVTVKMYGPSAVATLSVCALAPMGVATAAPTTSSSNSNNNQRPVLESVFSTAAASSPSLPVPSHSPPALKPVFEQWFRPTAPTQATDPATQPPGVASVFSAFLRRFRSAVHPSH